MNLPQFNDNINLSIDEIFKIIILKERELINLKFKKATNQTFKFHKIKHLKRKIAHLKTLLTFRINTKIENIY